MATVEPKPMLKKRLGRFGAIRNELKKFGVVGQGRRQRIVGRVAVVDNVRDIQPMLDQISKEGGGICQLASGTYVLTADISVPGGVTLEGLSRDNVIIDGDGQYSVVIKGENPYTTGTIAINDASTTVTGTGTTFTSGMVGQYIRLRDDYYEITAFGSTTSLTIGTAYAGDNLSGEKYAIADLNYNAVIRKLTIVNSDAGSLEVEYAYEPWIDDVVCGESAVGMSIQDAIFPKLTVPYCYENTTNLDMDGCYGFKIDYGAFLDSVSSGNNIEMDDCGNSTFFDSSSVRAAAIGIRLTNCRNIWFGSVDCSSNGSIGLECVSGCNDIQFTGFKSNNNGSDNFKLTATTDRCSFNDMTCSNAGGYGINIAASTCDNNVIGGTVIFNGNTSGTVNDSGTGTRDLSGLG